MSKRPAAADIHRHGSGKRSHNEDAGAVSRDHQRRSPRLSFPSYLDAGTELPPKICLLCEIIASDVTPSAMERALDDAGVRVSSEDVEAVLKLSSPRRRSYVFFPQFWCHATA